MTALLVLVVGLAAVACVAGGRGSDRPADGDARPSRGGGSGRLGTWWARVLAEAGVDDDPARWGRVAIGALALLALAAGVRGGIGGAVVIVVVSIGGALVGRQATRSRGARRADARLPELVEHVGRALRAGHDLRGAALAAGEVVDGVHGSALADVVARIDGGAGWTDALQGWLDDHPRRPVQLVAGALAVAEASGGRAGSALDGVAATLRARAAVADEARSLASQARASAVVLVALPVVVAAGGAAADPKVADALLGTPWGLACIALAALLDSVGALWMHRVVVGGTS